jgi:hypothetical protein
MDDALAGQAVGSVAVDLELIAPALGDLAPVIDHDQLIGQVEDEVPLRWPASEPEPDRLELEGEVVPEGAVETEV